MYVLYFSLLPDDEIESIWEKEGRERVGWIFCIFVMKEHLVFSCLYSM